MDHAAAEDFHPFVAGADFHRIANALIAHIHLRRRFGEGEVVRTETGLDLIGLEEGRDEVQQHALEVTHMGFLVDHQTFDLVEHGRVGLVPVAAIDAARRNDADRGVALEHGADLDRRRVRTQDFPHALGIRLHEEGVLGVARRVPFREVQGVEIVEVIFHVRTFRDGKAPVREDHGEFFHHLGDRVQRAGLFRTHGQRDVDGLRRQGRIERGSFQIGLAGLDGVVQPGLQPVQGRAHHLALFRAHLAQFAHHQRHGALLAQRGDAHRVQPGFIGRALDLAARLGFKRVEIGNVSHCVSSLAVEVDLAVDREGVDHRAR